MKKYSGKVAYKGVALGQVSEFTNNNISVTKHKIIDSEAEINRFYTSRDKAIEQLKVMHKKAVNDIGEFDAEIFNVHQLIILDELYTNSVIDIIKNENVNAEYAVMHTSKLLCNIFSQTDGEYMKERALDITDVSDRIISILKDIQNLEDYSPKGIVVCNNLSPSNLLQLNKNNIKGIIIKGGSIHSHTAILARAFSIPTLVSVDVEEYIHGKKAVINGYTGEFIIEPTTDQIKKAITLIKENIKNEKKISKYNELPCKTKDDINFNLYVNIGDISEVENALKKGANGIGLFRTEFLCMDEKDLPSEQEQYSVYKNTADMLGNKKLIIRTFDLGTDKNIGIFANNGENSSSLGLRAMRLFLLNDEYEVYFKEQISAILRASINKTIGILLPMVTAIWEVQRVKILIEEVKSQLLSNKIQFGHIKLGVMIETPSAALIANELAKEVDFFSIGTNDLTQYTLAADRLNSEIELYYNPKHPAVLSLIKLSAMAAKENNIEIEICGDLASDESMIGFFIKNELFNLSVSPEKLLYMKKAICEYSIDNPIK